MDKYTVIQRVAAFGMDTKEINILRVCTNLSLKELSKHYTDALSSVLFIFSGWPQILEGDYGQMKEVIID